MADKQIKQLTEVTNLEPDDLFLVQLNADSTNKKVKASNAFAGGWTTLGSTLTYVSNDGNKQATYKFTGEDKTGTIQEGMKLKLARPTAVGTQCTDLEASSSQYASKSSPSGITFADDYSIGGWVKLESLTGSNMSILSMRNSTGGWDFRVDGTDGTLDVLGINGVAYKIGSTYQPIPIGKWVHIAVTMDMSATTVNTYINGVAVSNYITSSGSPVTIVQAGNLELGSQNGGSGLFDGKIKHAFVADKVLSAAEVQEAMVSDDLTSASFSANLDAYFKLEGDFTDSSANGNDLTASGGAVATDADSPFSSTEYGIITSATFSTDTTVAVDFGDKVPVNENITAPAYSTHNVPYGFPIDVAHQQAEQVDGAWADWTPTWTNLTVGNGTLTARYNQIGKTVHIMLSLVFGSTTSISGAVDFTLPVACNSLYVNSNTHSIGTVGIADTGTAAYVGFIAIGSTSDVAVIRVSTASTTYLTTSSISSTVPFTWTTGDRIQLTATYEAA